MLRSCSRVVVALALATLACAGKSHLERFTPVPKAKPSASAFPLASASSEEGASPEVDKTTRWIWTTIGCQVGSAWSEALGAFGEERVLATLRRCRTVTSEILGTKIEDETALRKVRDVDAQTLDRIVAKIEQAGGGELAPLVRASAEASREALFARRAAESVRKGADLAAQEKVLSAKDALAKLWARKEKEAKTIALILAADHVEATRGLDGAGKIAVATPAFEVVFGVPKQSDWTAYLVAVAKAAGHPSDDEKSAFRSIVVAFADRFEQQGKALETGEAKEVSWGCARRLRRELKDQAASGGQ